MTSRSQSLWSQWWRGDTTTLDNSREALSKAVLQLCRPVFIVDHNGAAAVTPHGSVHMGDDCPPEASLRRLLAMAPPLLPEDLGSAAFKKDFGLRYAYIVGAMANGITSVEMVRSAGEAGMMGFFGAGGLTLEQVARAIDALDACPTPCPFGFNLIHSPNDPQLEQAIVDLYLSRGITTVSASAYLTVTAPLVLYRIKGIRQTQDGGIHCPNRIIAKVSRVEVARKFFSPPPQSIVKQLLDEGRITKQEADLARHIPLAQDMTAEADSGGHTDNRPALALLPTFLNLRNECMEEFHYPKPLRVGLAGGIATPDAAAAAFFMGAAYVLTGSINQSCVEADTCESVRRLLAQVQQADVTMAPAADMFELGAKVQVLKRGTMFAMRGAKLYDLYRNFDCYENIPDKVRASIEKDLLRASFEDAWRQTCRFFDQRDPSQIERGNKDPKHKMALVFRSYLGLSSLWAKHGDADRKMDYQVWCGPSMGAFNAWAKGSFLEKPEARKTADVGLNILFGAAALSRLNMLRQYGGELPAVAVRPITRQQMDALVAP